MRTPIRSCNISLPNIAMRSRCSSTSAAQSLSTRRMTRITSQSSSEHSSAQLLLAHRLSFGSLTLMLFHAEYLCSVARWCCSPGARLSAASPAQSVERSTVARVQQRQNATRHSATRASAQQQHQEQTKCTFQNSTSHRAMAGASGCSVVQPQHCHPAALEQTTARQTTNADKL